MINRTILIFALLAFLLCLAQPTGAQMQSSTYRIPTSTVSSGGSPMSSESYNANATVGQPSPLMDSTAPPWSANYDLYPGFWYTLEAGMARCDNLSSFAPAYGSVSSDFNYKSQCDFDVDGDIDGSDLSDFIAAYGL